MDVHDLSDFSDFDIEEEFISELVVDNSLHNDIQTLEEPGAHATVLSDNDNTKENNVKFSEDPEENNVLENNIEDFDNFEEYIENEQYEYHTGITDKTCEGVPGLLLQTESCEKYEEGSSTTSSVKSLNEQEEEIHVQGNTGEKKETVDHSTVSHVPTTSRSIKQKGTKLRTRRDKNQQRVEQVKPWYYRESKWYDKEKVREFMKNKYHLVEQQSKRQKHKKEQYNEEIDSKLKKLDDWIKSQFKSKRQKIADDVPETRDSAPPRRTPPISLNQSSSTTNAHDKMKEYGAIVRERRAKLYQQSLLQKQKLELQRLEEIRKRRIRTYKSKVHFSLENPVVRDRPSSAPSQLFQEGTKYPIIKKADRDVLYVEYDIPSFHLEDLEINFNELDEESSISSASTERDSLNETISHSPRKNLRSLDQKTESIISEQKREVDEPKKLGNSVVNEDINSKTRSKKEASTTPYHRDVLEDDQKMKERSNNVTHECLSIGREIPFRDWVQIEDEQQEDTYLTSVYERPHPTQAYESYEPCSNIDWEYDQYIMNFDNNTQSSQYPDVPLLANLSTESDAYELISYNREPPLFSPREFYCELEDLSKSIRLDVKIAKKQQNSSESNNDMFMYPSRKSVPSLSSEQSNLLSDTLKHSFDPVSSVGGISSISEASQSAMLNSDSFSAFQTSGKSMDMSMNTPFLRKAFPKKVDQGKPAESNNTVKKQDEDSNSHLFLKQLIEEDSDPFNIITVIALKEKKLRRERKAMKRLENTDRTLHPVEEQNLDEVTKVSSVVMKDTEHLFTKQDVQNQTDEPKKVTFNDEPNSSQVDFVSGLSHRNTGFTTVINEGQDVTTKLLETIEMYKAQLEKYSLLNQKLVNDTRTRDHEYSNIPEEDLQELYPSDTSSQPDPRQQSLGAENTVEPQPTSNIQLIYSPSELEHKFLAALDLFDTTQESRIQLAALEHTHAISSAHQEMVSMAQVLHRLDYKDGE